MEKFTKLTFIASLLLAGSAFAIPRGPCDSKPEVCCEEPKPGPFAFSYAWDRDLSCPADFYLHASFLIWQAKEDGLEFALDDANGQGFPVQSGNIIDFTGDNDHWHWNPGVRVGIGFYLNHDAWDFSLTYTTLNITDSKSASIQGGVGAFAPLWLPATVTTSNTNRTVSGQWKAYYSMFDLELGKPHHVSRYFTMNPFFGIRGGWINQHYLARYGGAFGTPLVDNGPEMNAQNDFWGVGIRGGVNVDFLLGRNFTLFGKIAGTMMRGKFQISQESDGVTETAGVQNYEIDDVFYSNVPSSELLLGVGWGFYFNQDRHYFGMELAWEHQHWWDQNYMRRFWTTVTSSNDTVSRGDLAFNGVNVKAYFDF